MHFFLLPVWFFSKCALFLLCPHAFPVCFLRCTTPRATTSSDKEPPETPFISLAKARWSLSHITGTRRQCCFQNELMVERTDSLTLFSITFFHFLSSFPMDHLPGKSDREKDRAGGAGSPVSAHGETVVWGESFVGVRRRIVRCFQRKWCGGHEWRMNDLIFLMCRCLYDVITFGLFREDIRTASVIAAGEVTCLVIDRE